MAVEEHVLAGGNATASVVRVGATVRKPWLPASAAVAAYMARVRAADVDVPQTFGRDGLGRQVIEHVPGELAIDRLPLGHAELARAGRLVRQIHDASPPFDPAAGEWPAPMLLPSPDPDLICHNDLAPWNLVLGERWVFIDWDGAGPSSRLWDLAYAAQSFTLAADDAPEACAARLRAFVDGYGADATVRRALPREMTRRTAAMHALLRDSHREGREPWGSMYVAGHGDHWRRATDHVRAHEHLWLEALTA